MGDNRLENFRFIERIIRESLGNPVGCDILEHNNTYTIKPQDGRGEVQINAFYDNVNIDGNIFYLLRTCNLIFDHCVFACEIRVEGESDTNGEIIPLDNKINFHNCTFQKPISFLYATFNNDIVFQHATFEYIAYFDMLIFNSRTDFIRCKFKSETHFNNSIFSEHVDMRNSTFQYIDMKQAEFKKDANFSDCKFQTEADFSKTTFSQKADFTRTIFRASAYFDNATFGNNADLERSEFCENAHFYQARFSRDPNFFQAMFNEHLNLTDTKIHNEDTNLDTTIFNFSFDELREKAQTCSEADKYRDIFKNIKNALIKGGNLLGASRFRKMELYCKEIELDLKKKEDRETSARDFVDRIQLMFYRFTSDHHTDLLLILNNVIILIACFGAINFVFNLSSHNYFKVNSLTIEHVIGALIACSIFAISAICLILRCCKKLFDSFGLVIDNVRLFLSKALSYKEQDATTCPRACIVFFSYITTIIILVVKPALLVPIFGQMIDTKSSIGFAFASLNIIYAIFMFLLIFSLQKPHARIRLCQINRFYKLEVRF